MTIEEFSSKIKGRSCSVVGLGISNLPLIDFLLGCGAKVVGRDRRTCDKMEDVAATLEDKGVKLILGDDYLDNLREDYIFRTPGLRPDQPQIVKAIEAGAILSSEMELFFELCPCRIIGITGSDGKTTTSTLTALILKEAGKRVWLGGNIGTPLLPHVAEMSGDDFVVVELSSFQLMTMRRSPDVSIVTNIAPNHLDWHTDMDEYVTSKENIFLWPNNEKLILRAEDEYARSFADDARGEVDFISLTRAEASGGSVIDGWLCYKGEKIIREEDIKLVGWYNKEHYLSAIAATYGYCKKEDVERVAKSFGGVEHRLEFVREKDGVKYYNSSIDSSPSRTAAALSAFDCKLIVICGGYDKKIPFAPLAKALCEKAKKVILTGATAEKIRASLEEEAKAGSELPEILEDPDFDRAIALAAGTAESGDIVLLSPGCASFDAFPNFEVRGRRFKDLVNAL